MNTIRSSALWKQPRIMLNIFRHPLEQDISSIFSNPTIYFQVNVHGEIQSYCALQYHQDYIHLKNIFTFSEFRGRGLASKLISVALKNTTLPVFLLCPDYRVSFYERLGLRLSKKNPLYLQCLRKIGSLFMRIFGGHRVMIMTNNP